MTPWRSTTVRMSGCLQPNSGWCRAAHLGDISRTRTRPRGQSPAAPAATGLASGELTSCRAARPLSRRLMQGRAAAQRDLLGAESPIGPVAREWVCRGLLTAITAAAARAHPLAARSAQEADVY